MNSGMWEHALVQANVRALAALGYRLVEPASGRMACGTIGPGKLPEPEEILERLVALCLKGQAAGQTWRAWPSWSRPALP